MKPNFLSALLLSVLIVTTGCANLSMPRTGFLSDYESLQPSSDLQVWGVPDDIDIWVAEDLAGKYDSVLVEPTIYKQHAGAKDELSEDLIAELTADFDEELTDVLGDELVIAQAPGRRTARLRAAITEVNPVSVWFNIIGLLLVVPVDMGGIAGEIEIVDSITGERQFAMTATREGTPFLLIECFSKYGHARHGMYKWAHLMRDQLVDDS